MALQVVLDIPTTGGESRVSDSTSGYLLCTSRAPVLSMGDGFRLAGKQPVFWKGPGALSTFHHCFLHKGLYEVYRACCSQGVVQMAWYNPTSATGRSLGLMGES